mmetsp:Transcript_906/g.3820  ORF Transcript_906/g.3820 Transcript_906/m.3820 type:complete len:252 (-) Transcript_906:483-1238(-)
MLKKGSVELVSSESNGDFSTRGGDVGSGGGVKSSPEKFPVWCWFAQGKDLSTRRDGKSFTSPGSLLFASRRGRNWPTAPNRDVVSACLLHSCCCPPMRRGFSALVSPSFVKDMPSKFFSRCAEVTTGFLCGENSLLSPGLAGAGAKPSKLSRCIWRNISCISEGRRAEPGGKIKPSASSPSPPYLLVMCELLLGEIWCGEAFFMCRTPRRPKLESVPGRIGSSFKPLGWPKSAGACVRVARLGPSSLDSKS